MAAGFYDLFSLLYHWFASVRISAEGDGGVAMGGNAEYQPHMRVVPRGGVQVFNCAEYSLKIILIPKFAVGSIVYVKKDAVKGILTKIFIKKVKFLPYVNKWTPIVLTPLYSDMFNSLYNEQDLCTLSEAEALISLYLEKYKIGLEEKLKNC
jgi:hypothetical protein